MQPAEVVVIGGVRMVGTGDDVFIAGGPGGLLIDLGKTRGKAQEAGSK